METLLRSKHFYSMKPVGRSRRDVITPAVDEKYLAILHHALHLRDAISQLNGSHKEHHPALSGLLDSMVEGTKNISCD